LRHAILAAALFLAGSAAHAAPTCLDRSGETIRCGVEGAMPVGWSPPADQAAPRHDSELSAAQVAGLVALLAGLFALIGLMPEFDGWERDRDGD
jgi:hypothetical protein